MSSNATIQLVVVWPIRSSHLQMCVKVMILLILHYHEQSVVFLSHCFYKIIVVCSKLIYSLVVWKQQQTIHAGTLADMLSFTKYQVCQ